MSEINSLLKAIGVLKDNLDVAVNSFPEQIVPNDVRLVKYIIKDLMEIEDKIVKELCSRDALE
jgi:hypothetical protein